MSSTLARQGASTGVGWSLTRDGQTRTQLELAFWNLVGNGVVSGGKVSDNGGLSVLVRAASKFFAEGVILALPASVDLEAGNSESLYIADNSTLSVGDVALDICCFVNLESTPTAGNDMAICGKWQSADLEYVLKVNNTGGTIRFQFQARNTSDTTTTTVSSTTFGAPSTATTYFVHAYHDPATDVIGIAVNNGTADTAATTGGVRDGTAKFAVGEHTGGSYFDGRIDSLGIWKSTLLTAGNLTTLYNAGVALSYSDLSAALTANLISWWDFDEESDGAAAVTRMDADGANNLTDSNTCAHGNSLGTGATYNGASNGATNTIWARVLRTAATQSTASALDTYALDITSNTTDVSPGEEYFRLAYVVTSGGAITLIENGVPGKFIQLTDHATLGKTTVGTNEAFYVAADRARVMSGPLVINGEVTVDGRLVIL